MVLEKIEDYKINYLMVIISFMDLSIYYLHFSADWWMSICCMLILLLNGASALRWLDKNKICNSEENRKLQVINLKKLKTIVSVLVIILGILNLFPILISTRWIMSLLGSYPLYEGSIFVSIISLINAGIACIPIIDIQSQLRFFNHYDKFSYIQDPCDAEIFRKSEDENIKRKYGMDTICINNGYNQNIVLYSILQKKIIINDNVYGFEEICSYVVSNDLYSISTPTTYKTKTKTKTSSVIGRSIAGGLIAGPVGAIIGGLSAEKETFIQDEPNNNNYQDYNIKIYGPNNHQIETVYSGWDQSVIIKITHILDLIISENNSKDKKMIITSSIADELAKLAKLRDDGILTDDEFENQKTKLLNG